MDLVKKFGIYVLKAAPFVVAAILLNIVPAKLVSHLGLPLYFDCLGTITAALLCGNMPAVCVGFFSNAIDGISDTVTLYYGVISILIAIAATAFVHRKFFSSIPRILIVILVFALIGGGLGSLITYLFYGYSIGEGISAPFALGLRDTCGLPDFWAQLLADIIIDIFDKGIVVIGAILLYKWIPSKVKGLSRKAFLIEEETQSEQAAVKRPLLHKVVLMVIVAELLLGTLACSIGFVLYRKVSVERFTETASGITKAATEFIDASKVDDFIAQGTEAEGYQESHHKLSLLKKSFPQAKYLYVYKILEDGCHVVFDMESDGGEEPSAPGDIIPFDASFESFLPALLKGDTIAPIITDDTYGWLLTVYRPLRDSRGTTVAYVASDISMDEIINDTATFFIKFVSLFFGLSLIIISVIVELVRQGIVRPINRMAYESSQFAFNLEQDKDKSLDGLRALKIKTFDEIEFLYKALTKMGEDSLEYIRQLQEQNGRITRMQDEIIINFAEMVEARDTSTGNHIKKTAYYVEAIARELQKEGKYRNLLDNEYIDKLKRSAPLHDIGKIAVSDLILNKPGKLTDEEFAIMKTHTTEGKNILEKIVENTSDSMDDNYLKESIEMAHYHHEKWDGSGYPTRIKGEEIPLSARIMAVADVFDALVAERIYKKPFTYEKAMAIITEGAGKHFDPVVVEAFTKISDHLYSERTKLEDLQQS
jgi:HD-GYP domain-containing protein (c-di-GMP phosphodiesterase class II)